VDLGLLALLLFVIINAAYTAFGKAEQATAQAFPINGDAVKI
jgi:dTDP-4-dehydrorhamnose reductase